MTFEELEDRLPSGFHDAAIREIKFDFIACSATVSMDILTGGPDDHDSELYRPGKLRVTPLYLFFIEPPDPKYPFFPDGSHLRVDGDSVKVGQNTQVDRLLQTLPQNAATYRFFMAKWNSFLYVAGGDVEFSWDDGERFNANRRVGQS
jgi:hypothetical protein